MPLTMGRVSAGERPSKLEQIKSRMANMRCEQPRAFSGARKSVSAKRNRPPSRPASRPVKAARRE